MNEEIQANNSTSYDLQGQNLLDDIAKFIREYVVLSASQADTLALWVVHTHAIDAADVTPYLHITSAEKRSGKTRLLEVLEQVVNKPWLTGRVTPAVLYRRVDQQVPTLLLDETDTAFRGNREYAETLRGVLNSGYKRGGKVSACVGQGASIGFRDFSTFCPKAIAGIGNLPDTVTDRSIPIKLKRRTKDEPYKRFRRTAVEPDGQLLKERIAAWVLTFQLREAEPELPDELDDRAAECWEPLLAISDAMGADWAQRARRAAIDLSSGVAREEQSLGTRLLADIKCIFDHREEYRISSAELSSTLNAQEESPWSEISQVGITPRKIATTLRPYGISPRSTRIGSEILKGYDKNQFTDAWSRYVTG